MGLAEQIHRYGIAGSAKKAINLLKQKTGWYERQYQSQPKYQNPTADELLQIESDLRSLGVQIEDYIASLEDFQVFTSKQYFSLDYHGGQSSGVWDEKMLEHWLSLRLLDLPTYTPEQIYVDVAAAASPWVQILREHEGLTAYAIDMDSIGAAYRDLPYYRVENATSTSFANASVKGVSLHCAYEMFMGDDDTNLISELSRILAPGAKAVILPLYMHTHYCAYSSPEYFGKGYSAASAKEYVRMNASGIPSSRKYDAENLQNRVLNKIHECGMSYRLLALRNKQELGANIYCHFILEISR
jgi:hypothetical protein